MGIKWESAPIEYTIGSNRVHVWRACYYPAIVANKEFVSSLCEEEIETARRFIRQADRNRYIFAHSLLRSILSTYVGCRPGQLVFESIEHRKPILRSPKFGNGIQFSLSHSKDMVLLAITRGVAVGVDIEYMRKIPEVHQIVKSNFSAEEQKFLDSLPPSEFEEGFYACWTSKEAYLKGIGKGLSHPLENFSILFSNLEADGFIDVQDNSGHNCSWKIIRLAPGPGYSGALAVEDQISGLETFDFH
jgi:4'-phosphopantetheinyl transferase